MSNKKRSKPKPTMLSAAELDAQHAADHPDEHEAELKRCSAEEHAAQLKAELEAELASQPGREALICLRIGRNGPEAALVAELNEIDGITNVQAVRALKIENFFEVLNRRLN